MNQNLCVLRKNAANGYRVKFSAKLLLGGVHEDMLEYLFPLEDRAVRRYIGLPVRVTMQDGSRYSGILTSCYDGLIGLNGGGDWREQDTNQSAFIRNAAPEPTSVKKKKGARNKKKRKGGRFAPVAATQAFPFDPADFEPLYASEQRRRRERSDNNSSNNSENVSDIGNRARRRRNDTSGTCIGCSDGIPTEAAANENRSPLYNRRRPCVPFRYPVTLELEDVAFLLVIV